MGLLSGPLAVTRFNAAVPPDGPDFERVRFFAIEPGSEVRERMGIVPFELDAPYEVGKGRWAFRVRIDRIKPDPTSVRERVKERRSRDSGNTVLSKEFPGGVLILTGANSAVGRAAVRCARRRAHRAAAGGDRHQPERGARPGLGEHGEGGADQGRERQPAGAGDAA